MSNILNSIKADLLSRRMLPIVALIAVALVGAVAYAVVGGGSSSPSTPVAAAPTGGTHSAVVTETPSSPNEAVSETPGGTSYQREGGAHDPFIQLPVPKVASVKSASKTAATTTTQASQTPAPAATKTPKATPKPKPAKPTKVYQVAALFGPAPTAPGVNPTLTPFEDLKRLAALPSASNPLIIFKGVGATGKGAIFVLVREAILKGEAACLPNANQCEAIDLAAGQTEELSYLQANGQTVSYQLQLVSISEHEASPTAAARSRSRESQAGRALLRRRDLPVLAELRYSPSKGVVVFRAHHHR